MLTSPSVIVEPPALEDSGLESWRQLARVCALSKLPPDEIDFIDARSTSSLPLDLSAPRNSVVNSNLRRLFTCRVVSRTARIVACHRDPQRWNLLYRLLWRLQSERKLLHIESDHDVAQFRSFAHQVNHDLHKMHAFVRFRRVRTSTASYIAWHSPRTASSNWRLRSSPNGSPSCVGPSSPPTPQSPGIPRRIRPPTARAFPRTCPAIGRARRPLALLLRQHLQSGARQPRPHALAHARQILASLPEVELLPTLLSQAGSRVGSMVAANPASSPPRPTSPRTSPVRHSETLPSCRGCDLYRHATQVVAGKGSASAGLMLIGEQPGRQEDTESPS